MTTPAATLLVELVTEELPPKALQSIGIAFADRLYHTLAELGFVVDDPSTRPGSQQPWDWFATPRRLAVSVRNVAGRSPDTPFRQKILPVTVAYDAQGRATPALAKKLAALGLAADAPLVRASDGKTEALFHDGIKAGIDLASALQDALAAAIGKLPIPKVMSYAGPGQYFNDQKFVRPAHGLVALHGATIVPVTALGLAAGRTTRGHRFLAHRPIDIAAADAYAPTLEAEGKVVPSFAARRAAIVVALEAAAGAATPVMPDALLDEVTALVEWPVVYAGSFDAAFLVVPQECLILTMQLNQRYFALADDAGRLVDRFLVVSNLATTDPAAIVAGNERVLRARLADARFFFDQDRKLRLEARLPKLETIVYHNKLGSLAQRVARVRRLAAVVAPLLGADAAQVDRAALLAKADLVTDMVGEFPELQGLMGRYYATHDGETAEVAAAIEEHYWPKAAGGDLPRGTVAQAVALADKLEAMVGLFGIGQRPTGDKDPFGLRRAALGALRIMVERGHAVSLTTLLHVAIATFDGTPGFDADPAPLSDFLYERLRGYLRDQGYSALQVAAVLDTHPDTIADLPARLAAVQSFTALPEAAALAAANKRIVNILRKSGIDAAPAVDRSRLEAGAEHDLFMVFQRLAPQVENDYDRGDYAAALHALAGAKPAVDRYFDEVMVMADDPALRANRLALLHGVAHTMNRVADIGKLAQ